VIADARIHASIHPKLPAIAHCHSLTVTHSLSLAVAVGFIQSFVRSFVVTSSSSSSSSSSFASLRRSNSKGWKRRRSLSFVVVVVVIVVVIVVVAVESLMRV